MLHGFDPTTALDETLQCLSQIHAQGKISSFGCSNYNPLQLKFLFKNVKNAPPFIAAQCHYNLIERRAAKFFIPFCEKHHLWVIVNRAFARGALSGKYEKNQRFPQNSRAAMSPRIQKWLSPKKIELIHTLSHIAMENQSSLIKIAIQWLLKTPLKRVILLGVRNQPQLTEALSAFSEHVNEKALEKIESILKNNQDVYESPPRYFEK